MLLKSKKTNKKIHLTDSVCLICVLKKMNMEKKWDFRGGVTFLMGKYLRPILWIRTYQTIVAGLEIRTIPKICVRSIVYKVLRIRDLCCWANTEVLLQCMYFSLPYFVPKMTEMATRYTYGRHRCRTSQSWSSITNGLGAFQFLNLFCQELGAFQFLSLFLNVALASLYCTYLKRGLEIQPILHLLSPCWSVQARTISSSEAWCVGTGTELGLGGTTIYCHLFLPLPYSVLSEPQFPRVQRLIPATPSSQYYSVDAVWWCVWTLQASPLLLVFYYHRPGYEDARMPTAVLLAVKSWTSYLLSQPQRPHRKDGEASLLMHLKL